jgi:hypothetical protein
VSWSQIGAELGVTKQAAWEDVSVGDQPSRPQSW